MRRSCVLAAVVAVVACAGASVAASAAPASLLGRNLLANGNAEAVASDAAKPPGWKPVEGFEVDRYGAVGGEWDNGLSGCAECKSQYLRLAFQAEATELATSQVVNVASIATQIDAGGVGAHVSAYLGGFSDSDTSGEVIAIFDDAAGKELARISTQPYNTSRLPKPPRGDTSLVLCEASAKVPAGTRSIVYVWKGEAKGTSADHLALGDDFSLVLSPGA